MSEDSFSIKEMVTRLLQKVEEIGQEQSEHIAFTRAKLESIEAQALKTNGRVTKVEERAGKLERKLETMGVKLGFVITGAVLLIETFVRRLI